MTNEKNFFEDIEKSCSIVMQMVLLGQNLEELAKILGCSVNYLYSCTNPDRPQIPNLKKFFLALRTAPQKRRVILYLCQVFGLDMKAMAAELRRLADELDGNGEE